MKKYRVNKEYLRRNLLHAKSVGVVAGIDAACKRLNGMSSAPKWLLKRLAIELAKAADIEVEMARHRDEVPTHK